MDANDVRIFCEMAFAGLNLVATTARQISPSTISRKMGLDEKTVRLRIRKMEESGFIKYYQARPNLSLLGMKYNCSCRFEAMNVPTKYGVLDYIQNLYGVVEAYDYLGPIVSVAMAGASETDIASLTGQIAGRFELTKMSLGAQRLRDMQREKLDTLDWKIIQKLRYDAHVTAKEVADALSITQRMSEYRIEKLLDSGFVTIRPVINPLSQQGVVFYELGVSIESLNRTEEMLRQKHSGNIWSMHTAPNGTIVMDMFGFKLAEPEERAMELLSMEGVKWCSIAVLKEVIEPKRPNWIDEFIQDNAVSK
jgi:DNA-binding Lrp family transcriptional regulator